MRKGIWRIAVLVIAAILIVTFMPYLGLGKTVNANQKQIFKANVKYTTIAKNAVQEFTVTTSTDVKNLMLYSEDGTTVVATWNAAGYSTVADDIRTWKVSRTIATAGDRKLVFKGGAKDTSPITNAVTVAFKVENTGVLSASAKNSLIEKGSAQVFTVRTTSDAKYLVEYAENGNKVTSWTASSSNSTVSGNVRTWIVSQKINTAGKRTLSFKAGTLSSTVTSAARTASFTVEENQVKEASVKFDTIGKGGTQTFMAKTSGTAQYLMLYAEDGYLVKTWKADDDNSYMVGDTRVWKVSHVISTPGNRILTLKAGRTTTAGVTGKSVSFSVVEKKILSAKVKNFVIIQNSKQSFTVETSADVKYLTVYAEGGNEVKTWTASGNSTEGVNKLRTWNVDLTIGTPGNRKLTFKGGTTSKTPVTNSTIASFKVEDVNIKSVTAKYPTIFKGTEQIFTVKTTVETTKLVEYAEDGKTIVKTWQASGNSLVSGDVRTWTLKQNIATAGNRSLTFKAGSSSYMSSSQKAVSFTVLSSVPVTAQYFPDANFRSYVSNSIDADKNGSISQAEIERTYQIAVASRGIASLKGIEFFSALQSLSCISNQLTSLDLSRNTALKYVYCYDNKLTSLDVSNCPTLKYLYCYLNKLTKLDVSRNTELTHFSCRDNELTTLAVSRTTKLVEFSCSENRLTSLDVKNNGYLKSLYCDHNQLTSLDTSKNKNLVELNCCCNLLTSVDTSSNGSLTTLNVSSNPGITTLEVGNLTKLQVLSCGSTEISALDLSHNTALQSLYCEECKFSTLDLSHNSELTILMCHWGKLTALELKNNPNLKILVCGGNSELTSLDVSGLPKLQSLSCYPSKIPELDLTNNTALESLSISSGTKLTGVGASVVITTF